MSEKQKILLFFVSLKFKTTVSIFTQEKLEAESDLCH